jgi:hypothetical protein
MIIGFRDDDGNEVGVRNLDFSKRLLDIMIHGNSMYSDEYIQSVFDRVCVHIQNSALYSTMEKDKKEDFCEMQSCASKTHRLGDMYSALVSEIYANSVTVEALDTDDDVFENLIEHYTFSQLAKEYVPDAVVASRMIYNIINDSCTVSFIVEDLLRDREWCASEDTKIEKNDVIGAVIHAKIPYDNHDNIYVWRYIVVEKDNRVIFAKKIDEYNAAGKKSIEVTLELGAVEFKHE